MENKDYNIMAHMGVTDMDYVEEMGMPEALVGTPAMNDWMIQHVFEGNLEAETKEFIANGDEPDVAKKKAHKLAMANKQAAQLNLKKVMKARGY